MLIFTITCLLQLCRSHPIHPVGETISDDDDENKDDDDENKDDDDKNDDDNKKGGNQKQAAEINKLQERQCNGDMWNSR